MSSPAALPFTGHDRSRSSFGVPSVVSEAWMVVASAGTASRADNAMMILFMILRFSCMSEYSCNFKKNQCYMQIFNTNHLGIFRDKSVTLSRVKLYEGRKERKNDGKK